MNLTESPITDHNAEAALVTCCLHQCSLVPKVLDTIDPSEFDHDDYRHAMEVIKRRYLADGGVTAATIEQELSESARAAIYANMSNGEYSPVFWDTFAKRIRNAAAMRAAMMSMDTALDEAKQPGFLTDDAGDWLERHSGNLTRIAQRHQRRAMPRASTSQLVCENLEAAISGRERVIPTGLKTLDWATNAALPGTQTVLCGTPGSTKSMLFMQIAAHMHEQGVRVAVMQLESGRMMHTKRALAQRVGNAGLLSNDWCRKHGEVARAAYLDNAQWMESFGARVEDLGSRKPSHDNLLAWVMRVLDDGARVVFIDPVTSATSEKDVWNADREFVTAMGQLVEQYGASALYVTHPAKGHRGEISLEAVAGGTAWSRHVDSVLWLEKLKDHEDVLIHTSAGRTQYTINRRLHVLKARKGPGENARIGLWFDENTVRTKELGRIVRGE